MSTEQTNLDREVAVNQVLQSLDDEILLLDDNADDFVLETVPAGLSPEDLAGAVSLEPAQPRPAAASEQPKKKGRVGRIIRRSLASIGTLLLLTVTGRIIRRSLASIGMLLLLTVALVFGAVTVVCIGPSEAARDLFVSTMMETSALKFIPRIYFSEEQVNQILAANTAREIDDISTGEKVVVPPPDQPDIQELIIENVSGPTFIGKMMIVRDPSRLFVASIPTYSKDKLGELLRKMVERTGATAGINGGGFSDPGGYGKGGMPSGIVIENGKLRLGEYTKAVIAGFTYENKLIVGTMTGKQAIQLGVRDALSYGPAFVIDGEIVPITGTGGGLNPRTAIGQRADGAVLLLVIDGRQPDSLGASLRDVQDLMVQYGAVNAANMDGGSSATMIYNGELINHLSIIGERYIPTGWMVR
ncbi:MAG: phosphodiester glycosidase family protein [Clostridia bacterium]|nr:phosphodiester glycosidase family protein [Clostridia bacterium]